MARFARDCITAMNDLTKKLEISLGPDTGDLSIRVGLHSGPVTAGVLRGDKSRFQLFGDTGKNNDCVLARLGFFTLRVAVSLTHTHPW